MRKATVIILLFSFTIVHSQTIGEELGVNLSSITNITFYNDKFTNGKRFNATSQLECKNLGSSLVSACSQKNLQPEEIVCFNKGTGYGEFDVQWTCEADLQSELRLGSVEVVCERYPDENGPLILQGSCFLEYELLFRSKSNKYTGLFEFLAIFMVFAIFNPKATFLSLAVIFPCCLGIVMYWKNPLPDWEDHSDYVISSVLSLAGTFLILTFRLFVPRCSSGKIKMARSTKHRSTTKSRSYGRTRLR